MGAPGRGKLRAKRQQRQNPRGGHLVEQQTQHLQRGGVGPVQVFPDGIDRLFCCFLHQPAHQRCERLLLLLLGAQGQRGEVCRRRQRQEGGQERERVILWEPIVTEPLLEFYQLGFRRIFPAKLQQPLQVLNERIQSAVLVIGGTA